MGQTNNANIQAPRLAAHYRDARAKIPSQRPSRLAAWWRLSYNKSSENPTAGIPSPRSRTLARSSLRFSSAHKLAAGNGGVDRSWYLQTYPDTATAGLDPVAHYLRHGWREGRDPRPDFSTSGYLAANKNVAGNPLVHCLRYGGTRVPPPELQFIAE